MEDFLRSDNGDYHLIDRVKEHLLRAQNPEAFRTACNMLGLVGWPFAGMAWAVPREMRTVRAELSTQIQKQWSELAEGGAECQKHLYGEEEGREIRFGEQLIALLPEDGQVLKKRVKKAEDRFAKTRLPEVTRTARAKGKRVQV